MRRCYNDFEFDLETLFGMGPRRRHQRKRRRFKWRIFERGDLKFVILRLLSDHPMHGYEVMKALEKESGGYYNPSPGSVYPTLLMLEDEGYLESEEQDGKKVYSVTDAGREYLDENADVVEDVFARVDDLTDRFFGDEMRGLSKTFSRLAQMTFDEAFRWGADKEVLSHMHEILEKAVGDMEAVREKARGPSRQRRKARQSKRQPDARAREAEESESD
ncbi:MAG: PadR family transcriptional regulator [Longimicrobiales bacterium]